MHLEKLYPPPGAHERWTLLIESVGEVAIRQRLATVGTSPGCFYTGAAIIEDLSHGQTMADAIENNQAKAGWRDALGAVLTAYGAPTLAGAMPELLADGIMTPIEQVARHSKQSMPNGSYGLLAQMAGGKHIADLRSEFMLTGGLSTWDEMWQAICTSLELPIEANEVAVLRKAYGLAYSGQLVRPTPKDDCNKLIVRAPQAVQEHLPDPEDMPWVAEYTDDRSRLHRIPRARSAQLQSLTNHETIAKLITLGLVDPDTSNPSQRMPGSRAMRAYAGLLLGHGIDQVGNLLYPNAHNSEETVKLDLSAVRAACRTSANAEPGRGVVLASFEAGLVRVGEPYTPKEYAKAHLAPGERG